MSQAETLVREWFERMRGSGEERLPPERVLAGQLGLSRAALRKGLAALDEDGVLIRQVGRGTFLRGVESSRLEAARHDGSVSDVVADTSPRDLLVASLTLEPRLARLAAREGTARQFSSLREAEVACAKAQDWPSFERADEAFHRAIAAGAGNRILLQMFETLVAARSATEWGRLRDRPAFGPEAMEAALEHHARIRAAISERDADTAEAALAHHIMVEGSTILQILV